MTATNNFVGYLLLFFSICCLSACTGTKGIVGDGSENAATGLFPDPSKVVWSAEYLGMKDGAHPVSLSLASDGDYYHGIMSYLSSGTTFHLGGDVKTDPRKLPRQINPDDIIGRLLTKSADGSLTLESFNGDIYLSPSHPAHLVLNEYYNRNLTGDMTCVFTVNDILMFYSAGQANVGAHYHLKKVKSLDEKNPLSGQNWTKAYDSQPGKSDREARLVFSKAGDLTSLIFYDKENELRLIHDFDLKLDEKNRILKTTLVDLNDNPNAKATCSFSDNWKNLTVAYQPSGGQLETIVLQNSVTLKHQPLTHMDFHSWADMDVPFREGDQVFNQLMNDLASEWMSRHKILVDSVKKSGTDLSLPAHRFEFRSYIWHTISYLSDDIISLSLTRNSTHLPLDVIQVNYNFKTHQVFDRDDVFVSDSDYQEFIDDFLERAILEKPYAQDPTFREMMRTTPFRHMGVTDNGLLFSTDFNGLFGAIQVLIPFDKLRPYLNADGPLASFLY